MTKEQFLENLTILDDVEGIGLQLFFLLNNGDMKKVDYVPDESRKIFNAEYYNEKVEALNILTSDILDLSISIFNDIKPLSVNQFDSNIILNKQVA